MRRLFLLAVISAIALAKPETYKEKEDFQYSRSSSDEGSKSGYYGAQRGNMGGNYEKAHNMDLLAQKQLSGAVRQVDDIGDTSNSRSGQVFTSGNTRGIYGQGNYELGNLQGRNFQEGVTFDDSQTHSSLSSLNSGYDSNLHNSARYKGGYSSYRAQNSGYNGYQTSGQLMQADKLNSAYVDAYGRQTGAYRQSEYGANSVYDHSQSSKQTSQSTYGSNAQSRLVSGTPVKIVIRPGSTVNVPVAAEIYENRQRSTVDQNAINSDAEVLGTSGVNHNAYSPNRNSHHYESSYRYNKEWEKHDSNPAAAPLAAPNVNSFTNNNELYEDDSTVNNHYSGYNAASSRQSQYNMQHQTKSSASNFNAQNSAYRTVDSTDDSAAIGVDSLPKPKSYQSSYSYHKSWERQGDPYVIVPANGGEQSSQRLTSAANNQGTYQSQKYGRHSSHGRYYKGGSAVDCDCDEEGNIRVTRSVNNQRVEPQQQYFGYDGQEDLVQQAQNQWSNLEDLGQQSQTNWGESDNIRQQSQQRSDKLEDLGQQRQNQWDSSDKMEDLVQQSQNKWDESGNLRQQSEQGHLGKLEDLGQHSQLDQIQNSDHIYHLTQNQQSDIRDLGQQTQNQWSDLSDLGQQTQNQWSDLKDLGQQTQESNWEGLENIGTQNRHQITSNINQHAQNKRENKDDLTQQINSQWDLESLGQQTQHSWHKLDNFQHQSRNDEHKFNKNIEDKTHWDKLELHQHQQKENETDDSNNQHIHQTQENLDLSSLLPSATQEHVFYQKDNLEQQTQDHWGHLESSRQDQPTNLKTDDLVKPVWEKYEDDTQQASAPLFPWNFEDHSTINTNQKPKQINYNSNSRGQIQDEFLIHQEDKATNTRHYHTSASTSENSELQGLWNKIDNLAMQSSISTNNDKKHISQHNNDEYSYNSYHNTHHSNSHDHNIERSQYPWQINNNVPTTPRTIIENKLFNHDNRPVSNNRGDIGADDYDRLTIKKSNKPNTQIQISNSEQKAAKTPEEIETLSLTKENTEQANHSNDNEGLSVISLNQHWLEEEKRQNQGADKIHPKMATITTPQTSHQFRYDVSQSDVQGGNRNQQQTDDSQENLYLEQQSQTSWDQNLENLGQQVQNVWGQNENLEQQTDLTQQVSNFGSMNEGKDDFYKQRYHSQNYGPSAKSQKMEDQHSIVGSKKSDVELIMPTEVTTEKTGFWKSVGNKFVSAKDKVSSWFSKS